LIVLVAPALFLISCGGAPPDDAAEESAATPAGETTALEGEAAAGQPAPGPDNSPVVIKWIAMEQVSPIVGEGGTLAEALGLEMPGGAFQVVIEQGEKTPVTGHFTLATAAPDQREMTVHVVRGNAGRAEENTSLGWYRIEQIPPGPQKEILITLIFRVADNAVIGAAIMPSERLSLPLVPSVPPPER
jgi:molecular chaperone DnaK (HSP70)